MASASDAHSATGGGVNDGGADDLDDFFGQLDLAEEEFDDLVIEEEDPVINNRVRWLGLARMHTEKSFSQAAFFRDMRAAWNPTQEVWVPTYRGQPVRGASLLLGGLGAYNASEALAIPVLGCYVTFI